MNINTRDFGNIDVNEQDFIVFKQPILGFEEYKEFTLISHDDISQDFVWLQSVTDKDICFILVDPAVVDSNYHPIIEENVKSNLKIEHNDDIMLWSIVVVESDFTKSTANLKSPIVLNTKNAHACQVILDSNFSMKAKIFNDNGGN